MRVTECPHKPPPAPSNDWIARQTPEETRQIREPDKAKTLLPFNPAIRRRGKSK